MRVPAGEGVAIDEMFAHGGLFKTGGVAQRFLAAALEANNRNDGAGRLRAARLGPDGAVYVTTSNGENDKVLRVTPAAS